MPRADRDPCVDRGEPLSNFFEDLSGLLYAARLG